MKKEIFDIVKKESRYIGLLFLLCIAILKAVYFKEDILVVLRLLLSLFWLFILPGYFFMLYWGEKLDFTERIIVGIGAAAALIGIFSYYAGLIGLDMKYHTILLPLAMIIAGIIMSSKK